MTRWLCTVALWAGAAHADEGMWLPEQLPQVGAPYTEQGLSLDPSELSDPFGGPMAAIVSLGGCSASFVSDTGLIVTNHHCIERFLASISDAEHNRHADGYVAPTQADELSVGPNGRVWVVESLTDVTDRMMEGIGKRTKDADRAEILEANRKALISSCEERPNRRCRVASYTGGAEYRLVDALEIQDIRMVVAPAHQMGQFGGDVDNWMWPRHNADFAFIRAYVAPDGSSAPYSEDNVPYTPRAFLPLNTEGLHEGDFVMAIGYPGTTRRHALAATMEQQVATSLPQGKYFRSSIHDIYARHAATGNVAAAALGPGMSGLANYAKKADATLAGVRRADLLTEKQADEQAMIEWVESDRRRARRLMPVYNEMMKAHAESVVRETRNTYFGWLRYTAPLLGISHDAWRNAQENLEPDAERKPGYQERDQQRRRQRYQALDKTLYLPASQEAFAWMLGEYMALPEADRVAALDAWIAAQGGADAAVAKLYDAPALASADARLALLEMTPEQLRASDDPWVQLAIALDDGFFAEERDKGEARSGRSHRLWSQWLKAKKDWYDSRGVPFYQDANSTLRVTLGHVRGSVPEDGKVYLPKTTMAGFAAKVTGEAPFAPPAHFKEAAQRKGTSRWHDATLGDVPVNFLNTLDITNGNSGSATIDGQGRLVGLMFDGTYESIASDWVWMDDITRAISVDIRWILWTLDHTEGTERLLNELGVGTEK